MSDYTDSDIDISVVLGILVVFSIPLTLLIPNFSVWDAVPKIRVTRFHIVSQDFTWTQLNGLIITLLVVFFTFYLEIKKRKLDDMMDRVVTTSQGTEVVVENTQDRQASAMRASLELIDASTEHYERLMMLRDEMKRRERARKQHPPVIESPSNEM